MVRSIIFFLSSSIRGVDKKIPLYVAIDLLSTVVIFGLGMKLHYYLGTGTDYIVIAIVGLLVGMAFSHGMAHGLSISAEVILLHMAILFMIGRPLSAPLSDILRLGIIGPLLPFIPTGLFAGFVGGQIRKRKRQK